MTVNAKALLAAVNVALLLGVIHQITLIPGRRESAQLSVVRRERRRGGVRAGADTAKAGAVLPDYEEAVRLINGRNIFNLNRCPDALSVRSGSQIALLGTYVAGDLSGAIFQQSGQSGPQFTFRGGGRSSQTQTRQIPPKRFVRLGETLENGYTLTQVRPDGVTLSRGGASMEMRVERPSDHTPGAIAARAASRPAPPNPQQIQNMMMGQQLMMLRQLIRNTSPETNGGPDNRSFRSRGRN